MSYPYSPEMVIAQPWGMSNIVVETDAQMLVQAIRFNRYVNYFLLSNLKTDEQINAHHCFPLKQHFPQTSTLILTERLIYYIKHILQKVA
jgi:hypothetical protein